MKIITVGVTHKTAPVQVREQLGIGDSELAERLRLLCSHADVAECVVLTTCNRVEVYAAVAAVSPRCFLKSVLTRFDLARRAALDGHWVELEQADSVRHLFEVAAGLDAMVVGEQEIVAQVKQAFRRAEEADALGPVLGALFRKALSVSKRVRTETPIGRGAPSVASVAVGVARKIFGDLGRRQVVIVGAGDTAELTLRHLVKNGAGSVVAVNRSLERAEALASRFDGRAASFEAFEHELSRADIVISATSSREPVITVEGLRRVMRRRRGRPMFLIDIAVPRDVAPAAERLDGVYVYNIDDLKAVVQERVRTRTLAFNGCHAIVGEAVCAYERWLQRQEVAPTLKQLYGYFETVRVRELEDHLRRVRGLTPELREQFEQLSKHLVKELLHDPVSRLRGVSDPAVLMRRTEALNELFGSGPDAHQEESNE